MLNVSGHLLSTAEVESALIEHPFISECAVVAKPHDVKGECAYCFVTLRDGKTFTAELVHELTQIGGCMFNYHLMFPLCAGEYMYVIDVDMV